MNKKNLALGVGGALGAAVAFKLLSRPKTVSWEKSADRVRHSEHSHFAEVDGATVHYQEFGDADHPTMILIHGYTASTFVWANVAPQLAAEGFRVIALDLIGFGFSDKPKSFDYKIASQARIVERLMNRLGIGTAIIVGSSYGGAVAATLALDYAERVEKLVLVDAVCNDEALQNPLLKLAAIPGVGEILTPFLLDSKTFLKARMQRTLAPENHHLITDERIASVRRPLMAADGHHAVLATSRNWDACRIEGDAPFIKQPTLIIWGDKDAVIDIHNGESLYNSILNSRLVVFKNCGHVPQEENPSLFIDLVSEFGKNRKGQLEPRDADGNLLEIA